MTKSVMKSLKKLLPLLVTATCLLSGILSANSELSSLGNPYKDFYTEEDLRYARNIWDMQLFDNKIYLGAGNSSNKGPAPNAGRLPAIHYDLKTGHFVTGYTVAEEQIDLYRVLNQQLMIPGHDATQKWTFGNIYILQDGQWLKRRNLTKVLHVYDLNSLGNTLFAAVGLNRSGGVYISRDNGQSWQDYGLGYGRVYALLKVQDQLFATRTFQPGKQDKISVYQWQGQQNAFIPRPDLNISRMLPDTQIRHSSLKVMKSIESPQTTLYLAAAKHNDHQNQPVAAYRATLGANDQLEIEKISLPKGYLPRDILVRDTHFYLLASKAKGKNRYDNRVLRIPAARQEAARTTEVQQFDYSGFARSFEQANNCFYFGIGGEVENPDNWSPDEISPATGEIIRQCAGN